MELISQKQIKNQKILTKASLQALTELSNDDLLFCSELQTTYQFMENGVAYIVNDTSVLSTALGGNTRFVGISGINIGVESIIESLSIIDNVITLNDIALPTDITADNGGLILKGDTDKSILWDNATDSWNINQNVNIVGNLDVDGDITYIETETLRVEDKNIELAYIDTPTDDTANGGGLTLKGTTDKTIYWDKVSDNWLFNKGIDITGEVNVSDDLNISPTSYFYFGDSNSDGNCRAYISGNVITFERYETHNFNDWFLPSKDELNKMYENLYLEGVGGFTNSYYWSSSEFDINNAWYQYFDDGSQFTDLKSFDVRVRACRSFVKYVSNAYSLKDVGPSGGLIFYINNNGDNSYTYYECASLDQSISQIWSDVNLLVGTNTTIGSGKFNTRLIIEQEGHTGSAGKLCSDLSILYNNWFEKNRVTTDKIYNNQDTNINGDLEVEGTSKVTLGLEDTYVTTPIKLGSIIDTSFDTTKKSIVGAVNELKNEILWQYAGIVGSIPTFTITAPFDSTVTIGETTVRMFTTSDFSGEIDEYVIPEKLLTLTAGGINQFICVRFNTGVPEYYIETNKFLINGSNVLLIYAAWNIGTTIYYHNNDTIGLGLGNKLHAMELQTQPYKLSMDGGLVLSEGIVPNPRTILVSQGYVYSGAELVIVDAFNSSIDDMILVNHVGGNWVFTPNELVYNNTQYDDGTDLQTIPDYKYAVRWFYRVISDTRKAVLYTLGSSYYDNKIEAELEMERTDLPEMLLTNALFIGKAIIRYNNTSGYIDPYFTKMLPNYGTRQELVDNFNVVEGNGVLTGMTISINADTTKINIAPGTFYDIISDTIIDYDGITGVVITNLLTHLITYIALDIATMLPVQSVTPFTPTDRRTKIILGAAIHSNKSFVSVINNFPDVAITGLGQLNDLIDGLNVFNVLGNEFYANGINLQLNKSAGKLFKRGSNFEIDSNNPHIKTMDELAPINNIRYRLSDGTEYADTNLVDLYYQDSPTTKAPIGNNKYSIQRIVLFSSNLVRIQYGTAIYNSIALAKDALYTESFTLEQNMAENGLLRGFLIVQGNATDLSDPTQAAFIAPDRFGQLPAGSMGGTFNHSNLTNLDFNNSGHTGFVPSEETKEPTGFETRTTSTLSFDGVTRIFTITPISDYNVWSKGVKYVKTVAETVTLTTDTDGLWYIFFGTDGVLACSQSTWVFVDGKVPVATVYYDTVGNTGLICDERHGVIMDSMTHAYLHYAVGVRYISDLAGTFTNTTFSIGSGVLFDEDIRISIDPQTTCRVFYRSAGVYKFTAPQTKYYYDIAGFLQYDNASVLTPVTNNYYMAVWVFGTNDIDNPIYVLVGQRQDQKLVDAEINNVYENLNLETLPSQEMKLLYRVILRNFGGVATYIDTQDLRNISNLPAGTYTATDHNQLSNRDAAGNHTKLVPIEDTTTALQFTKANGTTSVLTIDTLNKLINIPDLTASQAVFTDASMNLVSNAITGTGNVVMSTSPTIATPYIDTITDANNNEELKFVTTASAVNEFTITNSATTDPIILSATGDDTDIDIIIRPKGAGTTTVEGLLIASPVLTDLKLVDTSADHEYVFTVSELTADRNVNLPLLIGDDVFVFEGHIQTLTNKTLTSPKINEDVVLTTTATKLNYLTSATGTTGTNTTNIVFSTSPTLDTSIIGSASFDAFNTISTTINAFGASTTLTIGGTPTTAITHNYSTNVTANATTKTINFGTGGDVGSTTNITMGSANGGTLTINNPLTNINGTLSIYGDIYQYGATYETHAEKLYTTNDLIITRDGAVSALAVGEYTGFQAVKYDGTNDGQLVFDVSGIARVGDVGSLQPLSTREETPNNTSLAFWNSTTVRFETSANLTYDGTSLYALSAIIPTIYGSASTTGTLTLQGNDDDLTTGAVLITTSVDSNYATKAGALQVDGGAYITKKAYIADTTDSTSNTTGSIVTAGGVGVAKSAYVGACNFNSTFTLGTTPNVNIAWFGVTYGKGKFVAVTDNGLNTTRAMYSTDGINWSLAIDVPGSSMSWRSVMYGNGKYVAVAYGGTQTTRTMYSTDGINWSLGTTPDVNISWYSITYGNGKYVAVAISGTQTTRTMYSTDGINWSLGTTPDVINPWYSITYGNGKYVAVASLGTNTTRAMYSTDGINWSLGTTPDFDISWYSVTYSNGKYVAVANSGTNTTRAMYSTDGINWSLGTTPDFDIDWRGITYGNGKYVAVANSGTNTTRAMYSTDGINWSLGTTPNVSNEWLSITYGNGKYVAVAYTGTNTTRAMYSEFTKIGKIDLGSDLYLNNYSYTYIGNETVDGSWRFYIDETDLVYERLEFGVWVEKSRILA